MWREPFETFLGHVAARLTGSGPVVTQAIRDYVLHDGSPQVLSSAATTPGLREAFLVGYQAPEPVKKALDPLHRELSHVDAAVALRWLSLRAAVGHPHLSGTGSSLALPNAAVWPVFLLPMDSYQFPVRASRDLPYPLAFLEAIQECAGWPPHTLLLAALSADSSGYHENRLITALLDLPELSEALLRSADAVRTAFTPPIGVRGLHLAEALTRVRPEVATAFPRQVAALLTSSSKKVRAAARPLLDRPDVNGCAAVREALLDVAAAGSTAERLAALSLLHEAARQVGDDALTRLTEGRASADRSATVRRLIEEWACAETIGRPAADLEGGDSAAPSLPAVNLPGIDWRVPITPELQSAIDHVWRWSVQQDERWNRTISKAPAGAAWARPGHPLDEATLRRLLGFLADAASTPRSPTSWPVRGCTSLDAVQTVSNRIGAVAAVKFLAFFETWGRDGWPFFQLLGRNPDVRDLLTVAALVRPVGVGERSVLETFCARWTGFAAGWPAEGVWPFFARNLPLVEELLRAAPSYEIDRARLYAGIATLPTIPPSIVRHLFVVALGTGRSERQLAQQALAGVPGKQARIITALSDGKGEVRAAAARWLGDLGETDAVPALETAYGTEKQDVTKAAILDALEVLGRPVENYLDVDALTRDAVKGATKPLPASLTWVPWDGLPRVRWGEGTEHAGQAVAPELVRWLVVQAVKAKSPEPNALLRRYCGLWHPGDRQALAQTLLECWLAQDTAPIAADEARKRAEDQARLWHGWITGSPQHYQDHQWRGWNVDQITAAVLPSIARVPAGSAIDSKGLLAVVAACGGGEVAPPVTRYLKEWFGHRTAQCKALLGMLAWVDHPAATALLLSVGNRFRTKGIQEEATRQAQALAERRGWTIDELADRTIPTAGLDDGGVLDLSYGPRSFTAVLGPDLTLSLRSPDGKPIKALPSPRSDDDAELAAAAKKTLSAAKKELTATVRQQTTRLYEAMCTGRDWPFDDWDRYLNRHPVLRHLVQRLVWLQVDPSPGAAGEVRVVQVFRPLDDGTLTDADDEPVTIAADARIRLAHDALLDGDTVTAWTTHLADYEVTPPFGQLGAGFWRLPPDRAADTKIEDFSGHVLEAFALRGRAGKQGWARGQAEDGGVFVTYRKRFPALRLEAVLTFTGNFLPEENRTVALDTLTFERIIEGGQAWDAPVVALGEVPPVLLSECRNDVRLMAAEGPGYDPDWEKTTAW